jgi:ribosomal protein S27AE
MTGKTYQLPPLEKICPACGGSLVAFMSVQGIYNYRCIDCGYEEINTRECEHEKNR